MLSVDVVVVAYNSREFLRACVVPLVATPGISVVVVDNACPERSYEVVEDLAGVRVIHMPTNRGFAHGCNAGWHAGSSRYVLFLNSDATLEPAGLAALADELDIDRTVGLIGARTLDADGRLDFSIRRFPSLVSTYAQALFVHRLVPRARWVDELVREEETYEHRNVVDWLSGACLLARRSVLEATGASTRSSCSIPRTTIYVEGLPGTPGSPSSTALRRRASTCAGAPALEQR